MPLQGDPHLFIQVLFENCKHRRHPEPKSSADALASRIIPTPYKKMLNEVETIRASSFRC